MATRDREHWLLIGLVSMSVIVGGFTGVGTGTLPGGGGPTWQVDDPTPTGNATRHEDPREADAEGDLVRVRDWLAGRMALRLEDCLVAVGAGRADVCELADEYPGWLGLYVDVVDDTAEEDDDGLGERFEEAGTASGEFARDVESFRETYRAYREARADGEGARARRLARELQRDGAAVRTTATRLDDVFTVLERDAGVDLSDARARLDATTTNVTRLLVTVEEEQFVETRLTAQLRPRTISFLTPGTVTGRLTTANDSPLADRTVDLRIGDQVRSARTDDEGRFSVSYRPTTVPIETDVLVVRFVPRTESVYLESVTEVPVRIEPVIPTISAGVRPQEAAYAKTVAVSGRVSAAGIGAPNVPVVVTLDGRRFASVRTDETGRFAATAPIAAVDGPGPVEVRVVVALEGRALETTHSSTTLDVSSTATGLSVEVTAAGPTSLGLRGRLETAGGVGVAGQPIRVEINGTPVETVRTGRDGELAGSVDVPASLVGSARHVEVGFVYAGTGTNLDASSAHQIVELPVAEAPPQEGGVFARRVGALPGSPDAREVGLGLGVGLLTLLLIGLLGWRRWSAKGGGEGVGATAEGAAAKGAPTDTTPVDVLEPAREQLATDADGAVMLAYAVVREAVGDRLGDIGRAADTHWEFLAACERDGLDESVIDDLAALTQTYERAAYAPTTTPTAEAEAALQSAGSLL